MTTKRVAPAPLATLVSEFRPGLHRHYKHGDRYVALFLAYAQSRTGRELTPVLQAHHHETRELLQVYAGDTTSDKLFIDIPPGAMFERFTPFVVYVSCHYGSVNARPLYDPYDDAWTDMMGEGAALVARFTPLTVVGAG